MIRGLYTASLGMITQMNKMDVVTNNIANVNTTGFKKDGVITQTFSDELAKRIDDPKTRISLNSAENVGQLTMGLAVDHIYVDASNGSLQKTEGPLDVALNGTGFFVISATDADGNAVERYTRDGAFTMTAKGTLVTNEGDPVMGKNGVIQLPNGEITIDETGRIYADNQYVDTLNIVDFEKNDALGKYGDLKKYGSNLFDKTEQSKEMPFAGSVVQGFLESSNVNTVKEMVEMISLSRLYEANQRTITTHDTILGKSANEIARK